MTRLLSQLSRIYAAHLSRRTGVGVVERLPETDGDDMRSPDPTNLRIRSRLRWGASLAVVLMIVGGFYLIRSAGGDREVAAADDPAIDPRARLEALASEWFQISGTITYITTQYPVGAATSLHQCLRQMFEEDRQAAIRVCSGQGAATLIWDPPGRWRMDVSAPVRASTLMVVPAGGYVCREGVEDRSCVGISREEAEKRTGFGFIFWDPAQLLERVGANVPGSVTETAARTIAGTRAECFSAAAGSTKELEVEWCYSEDGVLVFFSGTEDDSATTLEATRISSDVSDADLRPSTSV